MPRILLLRPDFMLIVVGWTVCRFTPLPRSVWDGAERNGVLPAVPGAAVQCDPVQPAAAKPDADAGGMRRVGRAPGIVLACALRLWPGGDRHGRPRACGCRCASTHTSRSRLPSGSPAHRLWPGSRRGSHRACRRATSPRSGRSRATAAAVLPANWHATRSSSRPRHDWRATCSASACRRSRRPRPAASVPPLCRSGTDGSRCRPDLRGAARIAAARGRAVCDPARRASGRREHARALARDAPPAQQAVIALSLRCRLPRAPTGWRHAEAATVAASSGW
jgi:hypothetical protein